MISSFLVVSQPKELIRVAKEGNKVLYFQGAGHDPGEDGYSPNRYFTSYNTQDVEDVELLVKGKGKTTIRKSQINMTNRGHSHYF
ncbi:MAG: hypothetical protein IPP15_12255 [Saprospiraceae bacterium]|uniref:Uncharacterized protein n=1 Tax=Candidatus Opimibacter skivensis TaxID=2982028 RepID=A0A9D7SW12_9BACT|nr:hypothetical protein [Candidatus Opimibacter skivensis]